MSRMLALFPTTAFLFIKADVLTFGIVYIQFPHGMPLDTVVYKGQRYGSYNTLTSGFGDIIWRILLCSQF